jgi:hypothetical protein
MIFTTSVESEQNEIDSVLLVFARATGRDAHRRMMRRKGLSASWADGGQPAWTEGQFSGA